MERLLSAKRSQEQFLFNLHTHTHTQMLLSVWLIDEDSSTEGTWTTSEDLAKDRAATITTSPSRPAGCQAQTSTTKVAMTTTATISYCSLGTFAMPPPREDLWPQTNSAGKQSPNLHMKVSKTSYLQQCFHQQAESGSCWLSHPVFLQQPEHDWYLTILGGMLVSPAPSTLF